MATLGVHADWNDVARTLAARLAANLERNPVHRTQPQAGTAAVRLDQSND
jgi:lipoyl(octanoyl) transferase